MYIDSRKITTHPVVLVNIELVHDYCIDVHVFYFLTLSWRVKYFKPSLKRTITVLIYHGLITGKRSISSLKENTKANMMRKDEPNYTAFVTDVELPAFVAYIIVRSLWSSNCARKQLLKFLLYFIYSLFNDDGSRYSHTSEFLKTRIPMTPLILPLMGQ